VSQAVEGISDLQVRPSEENAKVGRQGTWALLPRVGGIHSKTKDERKPVHKTENRNGRKPSDGLSSPGPGRDLKLERDVHGV